MRYNIKTISKKFNIIRISLYKSFPWYEEIIGNSVVGYTNNIGNIHNINIETIHQKEGYGSKLLQYSEDILKEKNKDLSHIRLTCCEPINGSLKYFYNKNGYICENPNCEYDNYDDGVNLNHVTPMIKKI